MNISLGYLQVIISLCNRSSFVEWNWHLFKTQYSKQKRDQKGPKQKSFKNNLRKRKTKKDNHIVDHACSTLRKLSRSTNIFTSDAHTHVCVSGGK